MIENQTDEDRELLTGFVDTLSTVKDRLVRSDARFDKLESDLRIVKQRGFRLTGATDAGGSNADRAPADPLLATDSSFQNWLKAPRGKKSSLTVQFPFKLERKATTGVGGSGYYPTIQGPQQAALRLVELLPDVPLAMGAAVQYTQEAAYTPGAAVVPEGGLKPTTTITFTNKLATVQTIATVCKASLQSLADAPGLQQWLDQRLRHAVQLEAEDIFLNAPAPDGLLAVATALHADYTPGTGATALDFIGGAISQLQSAGYSVDGVVMGGVNASQMRLLKATDGSYLWASPDAALGVRAVWSVPTVISPAMPAGQFLVGAFAQSTILFTRQQLTVEIAYENEDDFIHNLACLRGEERAALAIPVPAGLVKGTITAPVGTATPFAPKK